MKAIRRRDEIAPEALERCHDGVGAVMCSSLLDGLGSEKFQFMHKDDIAAGVSIGVHTHKDDEEIYFLFSGKGILTFDGARCEMNAGDISLVTPGHSHGFEATEDSVLIVVGSEPCKKP